MELYDIHVREFSKKRQIGNKITEKKECKNLKIRKCYFYENLDSATFNIY